MEQSKQLFVDNITELFMTRSEKFYHQGQGIVRATFPTFYHNFDDIWFDTYYKLYKYIYRFDTSKTIINLMLTTFKNTYYNYQKKKYSPKYNGKIVPLDDMPSNKHYIELDIDNIIL